MSTRKIAVFMGTAALFGAGPAASLADEPAKSPSAAVSVVDDSSYGTETPVNTNVIEADDPM
jgi:hypothetical protein